MTYEFEEEFQRSIISLLRIDLNFIIEALPIVKPKYFDLPVHQYMVKIIFDYYDKYKETLNDDILFEEFKKLKDPELNISEFRSEVKEIKKYETDAVSRRDYFVDSLEEFAKDEAIKTALLEAIDYIKDRKYGKIEESIRKALCVSRNVSLGMDFFDLSEGRYREKNMVGQFRLPFPAYNEALGGGLARQELAMVVACTGVGKSIYLCNQAVRSSLDGYNVLFVSLEMSETKIRRRLDSIMTKVKIGELEGNEALVKYKLELARKNNPNLGKIKIKAFPSLRLNSNGLRAYLNQLRLYENFEPDVIIVDYLELMRPCDEGMREYEAQERIGHELKGIMQELNCAGFTATQANREGEKVDLIGGTELADSYGKIRPMAFVFSLNQTSGEYDRGHARGWAIKTRDGKKGFLTNIKVDYDNLTMGQVVSS